MSPVCRQIRKDNAWIVEENSHILLNYKSFSILFVSSSYKNTFCVINSNSWMSFMGIRPAIISNPEGPRSFSLQKLNCLICSVVLRTVLLKSVTVHPPISISINCFVFSKKKWPNAGFGANASPNSHFLVMQWRFMDLVWILRSTNAARAEQNSTPNDE